MTLDQIADQKTNLSGSLRSKKSFLLAKPPLWPLSSKDPRFCSATFLSFDEVGTVASSFTCDFQPKAIIVTPNALHLVDFHGARSRGSMWFYDIYDGYHSLLLAQFTSSMGYWIAGSNMK
jgi:hypothetical protein